jgi:glycosidase
MLLTLPGIPGIYMGDEVGAAFEPYSSRQPMDWTDSHGLRKHYARLIALRQAEPALRSRKLMLVETSHADHVLAYLRPGHTAEDSLLVLLNYSAEPLKVSLLQNLGLGSRVHDVLNGETLTVSVNAPVISMPAYGARVLRTGQDAGSISQVP